MWKRYPSRPYYWHFRNCPGKCIVPKFLKWKSTQHPRITHSVLGMSGPTSSWRSYSTSQVAPFRNGLLYYSLFVFYDIVYGICHGVCLSHKVIHEDHNIIVYRVYIVISILILKIQIKTVQIKLYDCSFPSIKFVTKNPKNGHVLGTLCVYTVCTMNYIYKV